MELQCSLIHGLILYKAPTKRLGKHLSQGPAVNRLVRGAWWLRVALPGFQSCLCNWAHGLSCLCLYFLTWKGVMAIMITDCYVD